MLDDFREQADLSLFDEEPEQEEQEEKEKSKLSLLLEGKILGMTPAQRFIIAVLLLVAVCAVSTLCLLATNAIALPFL